MGNLITPRTENTQKKNILGSFCSVFSVVNLSQGCDVA